MSTDRLGRRVLHSRKQARDAYILLEMIIALTVFAIVAVGLTKILHTSIDSVTILERDGIIRRGLEGILNESRHMPKREEMAISNTDERMGISYKTELEELKFLTEQGEPIKGLYLLRATAAYQVNGEDIEETAEVYVHRP